MTGTWPLQFRRDIFSLKLVQHLGPSFLQSLGVIKVEEAAHDPFEFACTGFNEYSTYLGSLRQVE